MSNTQLIIENDTGVAGAATIVSGALQSLGYVVLTPTSGTLRSDSRVVDGTGLHLGKIIAPLIQADLELSQLGVDEVAESQSSAVVLELGSNDLGVTKITLPADPGAPSSTVGIVKFGIWEPDNGSVVAFTPSPTAELRKTTASPSPVASAVTMSPAATGTAGPPSPPPTFAVSVTVTPTRPSSGPTVMPLPSATPLPPTSSPTRSALTVTRRPLVTATPSPTKGVVPQA